MVDSKVSQFNEYSSYINRGINQERMDAILKYASNSILDIGCGSGAYVLNLQEDYDIKGIDYKEFPTWDEAPHLFSVSDASSLEKIESNSVGTITCFETLEHLVNPEKTLKEFHRICCNNIIITVPNCQVSSGIYDSGFIYKTWVDRTHIQFFEMSSISELVENSGFNLINCYYINRISLWPFLEEAFDFSGFFGRAAKKILFKREKQRYYITCLLVAEKNL